MRVLIALGGSALLGFGEEGSARERQHSAELAAAAIAEIAAEHEVIVMHEAEMTVGHLLELELRNALPERDVVGVLTQVVVDPERPSEPHAIAEVRSLRVLVDSGALVICGVAESTPVALDEMGAMRRVTGAVDAKRAAALLARRLDASLVVMAPDDDAGVRVLSSAT